MIYLCVYLYVVGVCSTALMYKALDETSRYNVRKPFWIIVPLLWPAAFPYAAIRFAFDEK